MIEVTEASIAELRAALEAGQTTAVELVQAYQARLRRLSPAAVCHRVRVDRFKTPGTRRTRRLCCVLKAKRDGYESVNPV